LHRLWIREGSTAPFAGVADRLRDADIAFGRIGRVQYLKEESQTNLKSLSFQIKALGSKGVINTGFDVDLPGNSTFYGLWQ